VYLQIFQGVYNYAKKLRILKEKTLFESMAARWHPNPALFHCQPHHLLARLGT